MSPRLEWIDELQESVATALGEPFTEILIADTVDPIKKRVILILAHYLPKQSFNPFQTLAHGFALANDCVIETVRLVQNRLILDVLIKRRIGPRMRHNPFKDPT